MAATKSYFARPNYPVEMNGSDSMFELDESDVFVSPELCKTVPISRLTKRSSTMAVKRVTPAVSVPEWSKMVKEENRRRNDDGDDYNNSVDDWIPPHEFLARTRIASFSVHEGVGRTLKGRDLSRVRDAIWEKIGFQD